jgi:hypothetical protein
MSYEMHTVDSNRNSTALVVRRRRKMLFILQISSFGDRRLISSYTTICATGEEGRGAVFNLCDFFQHSQIIGQVK